MTKNRLLENFCIIRIWKEKGLTSVGHVSLQTRDSYASLWPNNSVDKAEAFKTHPFQLLSDFEDDFKREKRNPDTIVCLYGLNVTNINFHFSKIRKELLGWNLTGSGLIFKDREHSCASLVYTLLMEGELTHLIPRPSPEEPKRGIPLMVSRPSQAIAEGVVYATAGSVVGTVGSMVGTLTSTVLGGTVGALTVGATGGMVGALTGGVVGVLTCGTAPIVLGTAGLFFAARNLVYNTKTRKTESKPFEIQQDIDSKSPYLKNTAYLSALNHFAYPSDSLCLTIPTPEDIERIVYIAKIFETIHYPETLDFPNDYNPEFHKGIKHSQQNKEHEKIELDDKGWTVLHHVVFDKRIEDFKQIWSQNPHYKSIKTGYEWKNIWHLAIESQAIEIINFLFQSQYRYQEPKNFCIDLNSQDREFNTPLLYAIKKDYTEGALLLLKNGSNPGILDKNYWAAIHWAIVKSNWEIFHYIWENYTTEQKRRTGLGILHGNETLLHLAVDVMCNCGHTFPFTTFENIKNQFSNSVNSFLKTPFKLQEENKKQKILDFLLSKKELIDVNARDKIGKTPLSKALTNIKVVKKLLKANADLNDTGGGDTILHDATKVGSIEVIHFLISHKRGLIETTNLEQETVLHVAVKLKNRDKIAALLEKGANMYAEDRYGNKPLDCLPNDVTPKDIQFKSEITELFKRHGYKNSRFILSAL